MSTNERINSQESSQISMWSQFSRMWATNCKLSPLAWANTVCSSDHLTSHLRDPCPSGRDSADPVLALDNLTVQRSRHLCCAVQLILNHTALGSDNHTHFLYIACKRSHLWHLQCPLLSLLWPSCQHSGQENSLKYGIGAFKHTL